MRKRQARANKNQKKLSRKLNKKRHRKWQQQWQPLQWRGRQQSRWPAKVSLPPWASSDGLLHSSWPFAERENERARERAHLDTAAAAAAQLSSVCSRALNPSVPAAAEASIMYAWRRRGAAAKAAYPKVHRSLWSAHSVSSLFDQYQQRWQTGIFATGTAS